MYLTTGSHVVELRILFVSVTNTTSTHITSQHALTTRKGAQFDVEN